MKTNLLTYLLTHSMEQSRSWEANCFATSQEIPRVLWNPKVPHCTHKRPPTVPILSQPNPVLTPTFLFLKIHPNIILPSTPGSPQRSLSLRFPQQNPVQHLSLPPYVLHAPPISIFSILSPARYWIRSTDRSAPHYVIFSIIPLPRPSLAQIFSSAPYSQTPSAYNIQSSGLFPGVWVLKADVSEPSVSSISKGAHLWRWNWRLVPKRRGYKNSHAGE
jgi:hypothetical protein